MIYEPSHSFNPIPTGQGRNQPLYERHVTKSGRNRVNKDVDQAFFSKNNNLALRLLRNLETTILVYPSLEDGLLNHEFI